jgi:hypothetical protein
MIANNSSVQFPEIEPEIRITAVSEAPFEVHCQQLLWWFTTPQWGDRVAYASYDYPGRQLTRVEQIEVMGRGRVYEEDAAEMRIRTYRPDGSLERECFAYGDIREGVSRWFGFWNLADELKFFTYRDEGFQDDWPDTPLHFVDVGRYHWVAPDRLLSSATSTEQEEINPNGAGLWDVKIGGTSRRCLRIIESPPAGDVGIALVDGFLREDGKTVLFRQWRHEDCKMSNWSAPARETLAGSPTLYYNDTQYYLYYNSFPAESL